MTAEFRATAERWRNIVGKSDEDVAAAVRADGIDILVDLTQHMAGNRLPVFARKPAPVQVSFAGYPGSTGFAAIDYRLSDPYLDPFDDIAQGRRVDDLARHGPPGMGKPASSEQSIRLPDSFWCYDPLACADVAVNPLPALEAGTVTFGCLNNFCKINDMTLGLWAQVLRQVRGSRLLLLAAAGSHHQRTIDWLFEKDIERSRIEFVVPGPRRAYLEQYHRVDIGLDSFPYNGHTTSLDICRGCRRSARRFGSAWSVRR